MDLNAEICGHTVTFLDGPYTSEDDNVITAEGIEFAQSLINQLKDIKSQAAETLTPYYNDVWYDDEDDLGILSEEQVANLLINPSITIYDETGAACIYFNDSNMFGNHYIEVFIDDFVVKDIGIVG